MTAPRHSGTDAVLHAWASAPTDPLPPTPEFLAACERFGLALEPDEIDRLGRFLALLLHVNAHINLTAIRDPARAWIHHAFDALTLIPLLDGIDPLATLVDVGSGGGVPGIPIAIARPACHCTLLEATAKKAAFLHGACERLSLPNVRVVCQRAETFGQSEGRARFDAALARALGPLPVAAELTVPLLRPAGRALLVKGERAEAELARSVDALAQLGAVHLGNSRTPTGTVVVLEKARPTPARFPRRPGEPARAPLGEPP